MEREDGFHAAAVPHVPAAGHSVATGDTGDTVIAFLAGFTLDAETGLVLVVGLVTELVQLLRRWLAAPLLPVEVLVAGVVDLLLGAAGPQLDVLIQPQPCVRRV